MDSTVITQILIDGSTTGIIQCDLDGWIGISYKIPRNKLKDAAKLEYINNTGVYILIGIDEKTGDKISYIGESENVYNRLTEHNRKKDFWAECLVFMTQNNSLDKGHCTFIENLLYHNAKEVERYIVSNEKNTTQLKLEKPNEIKASKFSEKIKLITSILGYRIFDKVVNDNIDTESSNILYLKVNGIEYAKGVMTDEGFVILKGSEIREGISKNLSPSLVPYTERERSSNDIVDGIFVKDHLSSSPSMALVTILGRNGNGLKEWKNKEGKSLKEIINE